MNTPTFFGRTIQWMSRNATTARNGNAAERKLCDNPHVRERLETYFGKPIVSFNLVPGKKKSDVSVLFGDGEIARIQNKEGDSNNRGWSADRRSLAKMPVDDAGKVLLDVVCLRKEGVRPENVPRPAGLIRDLLLGLDAETMPTHFTHTVFHKETGELLHLSIATAEAVVSALEASAYACLLPKRTCVHIAPGMYLQRKGGGDKDHAPNDIQLKLVKFPEGIMKTL
jgi:hypothetical protein